MQLQNSVPGIDELTQAGRIATKGQIRPLQRPGMQGIYKWHRMCSREHAICSYSARTLHEHIACKYSTSAHKKQSSILAYYVGRRCSWRLPHAYAMTTARQQYLQPYLRRIVPAYMDGWHGWHTRKPAHLQASQCLQYCSMVEFPAIM